MLTRLEGAPIGACGKVIIEENVFVGSCAVIRVHSNIQDVVRNNHELVQGYKRLQNES